MVAGGRHVPQHGREQRPADAVADHIDLGLAGGLLDRVQGGQRPQGHVGFPPQITMALVRIDPGDHEGGFALIEAKFDEAVLGLQVENVELVDPRWNDQ